MTQKQAERAGKALLKMLRGEGWELEVWEADVGWYNMGVYKQLPGGYWLSVKGVHHTGGEPYYCLLGDEQDCGLISWTPDTYAAKDPNRAVAHAVRCAKEAIAPKTTAVAEALEFLKTTKPKR